MYTISDELFHKIKNLVSECLPENKDFYSKQELLKIISKVAESISDSQFRKDLKLIIEYNPPKFIHALKATRFNRISAIYIVIYRILIAKSDSRYQALFALTPTTERYLEETSNERYKREDSKGYQNHEFITVAATEID